MSEDMPERVWLDWNSEHDRYYNVPEEFVIEDEHVEYVRADLLYKVVAALGEMADMIDRERVNNAHRLIHEVRVALAPGEGEVEGE